MGKLAEFRNRKNAPILSDTVETDRDRGDDYAVERKSTSFYVASIIISVLGAVFIWLFAVSTGTSEKLFTVVPELREMETFTSAAELNGFNVVVEKDTTVSFALVGRQKSVNDVSNSEILVFAELDELISEVNKLPNDKEQTVTVKIVIDAPVYFNVRDVSKEEITIKLVPINKGAE